MRQYHFLTALVTIISVISAGKLFAHGGLDASILSAPIKSGINTEVCSCYDLFSPEEQFGTIDSIEKGTYRTGDTSVKSAVGDTNSIPVGLEWRPGNQITIFTKSGRSISGELLRIRPEQLLISWGQNLADTTLARYWDRIIRIPAEDIASVKIHGHSNVGSGMVIGFLSGACVGALMGAADGDDPPNRFFAMTAGQKAAAGGLVLGLGGFLVGTVVGAMSSSSDKMIEEPSTLTLMSLQSIARYSVEEPAYLTRVK